MCAAARGWMRCTAARAVAATWRYPVEQLRERCATPSCAVWTALRTVAACHRVVAALVTGDQRAIERRLGCSRATGVAHLMSISGLHITLFAWLAAALLGRAWRRSARLCLMLPAPTAALVGGAAVAGAYALFSGWACPAQRTVVMLATVALLRACRAALALAAGAGCLACAVGAAGRPWALLQPGFWLSFVAVAVLFATDNRAVSAYPAGVTGHFMPCCASNGW